MTTFEFTIDDLAEVRSLARRAAAGTDLAEQVAVAVSELASNAIRHGGGRGVLTIAPVPGGVRVEVRDWGPGLARGVPTEAPKQLAYGGRGLWIVSKLFPQFVLESSPTGVTASVLLHTPAAPNP
ncbi:ATP-binding protein [Catellatospora sp. KI3]|uniref:ATP-binding protein n=1 Tax=Catellatospora sp. KI3 TaxID=3041620 RepID=UPI00248276E5|nr:ATP-binding protein [Catellatospora sp. KI3]MDI1463260.1 ATP-binding protein [Catellatospora sp. KI3]